MQRDEIRAYINNVKIRTNFIDENFKNLKLELESIFEKKYLEAGMLNPGYVSYFVESIENFKRSNPILNYTFSEEQLSDSENGRTIKIPIVDILVENNKSIRLFILPEFFKNQILN